MLGRALKDSARVGDSCVKALRRITGLLSTTELSPLLLSVRLLLRLLLALLLLLPLLVVVLLPPRQNTREKADVAELPEREGTGRRGGENGHQSVDSTLPASSHAALQALVVVR